MNGYAHRVSAAVVGLALVCAATVLPSRAVPSAAGAPPWMAAGIAPRVAPLPAPAGSFGWPLAGTPRVVRPFDPPPQRWLPGHRGVDLAAAPGATIYAAGPGIVRFAGMIAGRGVVSVEHRGGLRTTYEPVVPAVRTGDRLAAGDPIGRLAAGHPGCAEPACLHWGLRRGAEYLDPLALLSLGRVRLLPLAEPSDRRAASAGGSPSSVIAGPAREPHVWAWVGSRGGDRGAGAGRGRRQRWVASRPGRRSASRSYSSARL
jgi:murein DD-endopeptidase MepM/ murein hydrolase activator NlpD